MAQGKATVVEFRGEKMTLVELSKRTGISSATLHARIVIYGRAVEEAATTPVMKRSTSGGRYAASVPRPVPKFKRHPSGRAYSRWRMMGKINERYFGKHGSAEASAAYRKFAQDWTAGKYDQVTASGMKEGGGISVAALAVKWLAHVNAYYLKDGKPTSETKTCLAAVRLVMDAGENRPANDFDPAALRACQNLLVERKKTRSTANAYINRVVRMFAWGAGQSLVSPTVHAALRLVEKLKSGRSGAPDRPKKKPATDAQIEATLPNLSPSDPVQRVKLTAMIRLQRLTGMRPGEVCAMEVGDIDRSADVWLYTVGKASKNRHRGKVQSYYLGPKAVAILTPYMEGKTEGAIFGEKMVDYSQAIIRASVKAKCRWTPHQLRHALATEVAEKFRSLDYAAAAIGDTRAVAEAVYVHMDPQMRAKIEIARAMG